VRLRHLARARSGEVEHADAVALDEGRELESGLLGRGQGGVYQLERLAVLDAVFQGQARAAFELSEVEVAVPSLSSTLASVRSS